MSKLKVKDSIGRITIGDSIISLDSSMKWQSDDKELLAHVSTLYRMDRFKGCHNVDGVAMLVEVANDLNGKLELADYIDDFDGNIPGVEF